MRFRIEIPEGGLIPQGYGVAWRAMDRAVIVCLPLGLNVLAAWGRRLLHWLRFPPTLAAEERALRAAYEQGWSFGHEAGIREVRPDIERAYRDGRDSVYRELKEQMTNLRAPVA
jgi:hypothetical protein